MLRILTVAVAILSCATFAAAQNLKSATLLDGKVVISLPESFVEMTEEMKRFKYPTGTPPDLVFTDEDASVNVALRVVAAPAKSGDMGAMASAIAEQISKVRNIPTWHGKGARTIGGRAFGYLEFTSAALDTNVYNYMYFTVDDGKLLMFTVNTVVAKLPDWKDTLMQVIDSTRVSSTKSE